jgi:hypothetical protein
MPAIIPVHADGTRCTHRVTSTGKPLEEDCTGREMYCAKCSCGWHKEFPVKGSLAVSRDRHRAEAIRTAANANA